MFPPQPGGTREATNAKTKSVAKARAGFGARKEREGGEAGLIPPARGGAGGGQGVSGRTRRRYKQTHIHSE